MPLQLGVWRIDQGLVKVSPTKLDEEARLETFIHEDVSLVREDLWIVGRQVATAFGHFIDLLALDGQGNLVVLELKRDKTPREVVSQTLDYGAWVRGLGREDVARVYEDYVRKYRPKEANVPFEVAFASRFGGQPPEVVNESHELVIVASMLDDSTERIIEYLADFGVPVNAVFFRVFKDGEREYLTRAWLKDPSEAQAKTEEAQARQKGKEPWNGNDFYVSFGHGDNCRDWDDAREHGFVSAGGGEWFTRTMRLLQPGHRVFVHVPKKGFVGVGVVIEGARRADEVLLMGPDGKGAPLSSLALRAKDMLHDAGDDAKAENVVRVKWLKTVPLGDAVWAPGMFANQNSVCKLRSKFTIEEVSKRFDLDGV